MKFSIIIPVYNVEKYLDQAIESILVQTFKNYELLLIDDGSRDKSGFICDSYAADYCFIKAFHKQNGGQSSARNLGIEKSIGDYIIFLDSDDYISNDSFLEALDYETRNNPDIILYKYQKMFEASNRVETCNFNFPSKKNDDISDYLMQLIETDTFFCSAWSKSIKSSLIKNNNCFFTEGIYAEDIEWYYRILKYTNSIGIINKPFVHYRQRTNSITSSKSYKNLKDNNDVIKMTYNFIITNFEEPLKTILLNSLGKMYLNLIVNYSCNPNRSKQIKLEIKKMIFLFKYNANPRVKIFSRLNRFVGFTFMTVLIRIYSRIKKRGLQ